jgi:tetratricopeptide (TPR) repeat protein
VATLVGSGKAAFNRGNFKASIELFEQALAKAPTDAAAYYDLGTVYQAERLDGDALHDYAKALTYDSSLVPAIYNEATIYAANDVPLAIYLYRRVIALRANSPTAYLNLGLLEATEGQQTVAAADLRRAVQLEPALRTSIPASLVPDLSIPSPPSSSGKGQHPSATTSP